MAALTCAWNYIVGTAGLIAIIVLAFRIVTRAIELADVPKHLAIILGTMALVIMLSGIIVGLWRSMSFAQHLVIFTLCVVIAILLNKSRNRTHNVRRK